VLWWTAGIALAALVAGGLLLRSVLRSPTARARLTVLDGPQRGTAHLVRKRFVMGTDSACDLVLPGPYVGRRHAEVRAEEGTFRLVDLQSKNGTFLNGTRVENVLLQAGDTIGLAGEVHLAVELL
jgi:pSer/pThr/pTyr-binding forkhead associated (FHA) protein